VAAESIIDRQTVQRCLPRMKSKSSTRLANPRLWLLYYRPEGQGLRLKLISADEQHVRWTCEEIQKHNPNQRPHIEVSTRSQVKLLELFGRDLDQSTIRRTRLTPQYAASSATPARS
jgi:hypothetical protein